jgi:ketosteroid isomerase-like protein
MKRYLTACAAVLLFALGIITIVAPTPAADSLVSEVTKANDVVQLATLKHDRKTMDAMITKDFILVLTHGQIEDRAAWLNDIADTSAHMEVNQTSDLSIHQYNGDSALVIGVLHIRSKEKNKVYDVRMRFIDVWVKQDGQWKWASSQVAHFPDPSTKS